MGLRYVRARTHKFFVSFITWVSLIGVCVGVAALIVILSVMNGLEGELRDRLLSLSSHARVVPADASGHASVDWQTVEQRVSSVPGVVGFAPYAELQVLAVRTPEMLPVTLRGIDPAREASVTAVAQALNAGSLSDLEPRSDRLILGEIIAQRLGVTIGDGVTLLVPTITGDGTPAPRLREFTVAGTFEVGLQDHDAVLVFAHIDDVRPIAAAGAQGLRLRYEDVLAAPVISQKVREVMPDSVEVISWEQDHASYFRAIRIEKTMMSLILMLIVGVAAFNIVAMLVMVVTDKRTDIAILRTFGVSPRKVMGVFITQGLVIGWFGVALGVVLGVILAQNVGTIVPFLERTFGFQVMDSDVFVFSAVPSELRWPNVFWIGLAALVLTALSTIYPAIRAANTPPADALRYE